MVSSAVLLQKIRADSLRDLQTQISEAEARGDTETAQIARSQFQETESQIIEEFHRLTSY